MQANKINIFRNTTKMVEISNCHYEEAYNKGIMGLYAYADENRNVRILDKSFIDFTRCSYLGLDSHPKIVEASINAIRKYSAVQWSCARTRLNYYLIKDLEDSLSKLFNGYAVCFSSVTLANTCVLPLLASGSFNKGIKPTIVFDKHCHASLSFLKPVLADETKVLTIGHNDLASLERICKSESSVVYIADGVYSMGGNIPLKQLLELQDNYNLFLYIDDAHGVSITGSQGEGFVRSQLQESNPKIITAASLAKGFGASGGALILASEEQEKIVRRFGSSYAFSALPNIAAVGGSLGSVEIHRSNELANLQKQLQEKIKYFDAQYITEHSGNNLPIRIIKIGDEFKSLTLTEKLMQAGFYVSPVFFPIVPKNHAAIRLSLSATHTFSEIYQLCETLKDTLPAQNNGKVYDSKTI